MSGFVLGFIVGWSIATFLMGLLWWAEEMRRGR